MINLITGTPGAGKTYLAVKLLTEKYFFWHRKDRAYYRKSDQKKYTIITNIKGLQLPHKNLADILKDNNITFDYFFSPAYQDKIHKKYKYIIYVIDECQQFIPPRYSNKDTILYFDTHRHYGDKIWLITQDYTKICKPISSLVELEYRAVKATFSLLGEFRYNIKSNGQIFKRKTTRKDKRIFALYKSFEGDDQEQPRNPLKYIIVGLIVAFVIVGYLFFQMITPGSRLRAGSETAHAEPATINPITKTPFAGSKQQQSQINLNQIRAYRIRSFVENSEGLFAYECPITGRWIYETETLYKITKSNGRYYILLSLKEYQQIKIEHDRFS